MTFGQQIRAVEQHFNQHGGLFVEYHLNASEGGGTNHLLFQEPGKEPRCISKCQVPPGLAFEDYVDPLFLNKDISDLKVSHPEAFRFADQLTIHLK